MSTTANPTAAQQNPVIDPELPAPLSMGDVLRVPMMRRLWYAQIISVFGDFLALFAAINVISSFFGPAQGVAIRSAVPLHGLRSANSLMQQVMFGMRIIGPPVAGLFYVALGARTCYIADSTSFVCSGLLTAPRAPPKPFTEALSGSPAPAPTAPNKGLAGILPDMRE